MNTPTPELLDEARRELRALLDDLRADAARAASDHHAGAVCRLCSFLGLTVREREFVRAALGDAADFDLYSVLADYLLDQGRTKDGARVRRLVPKDGDVLLFTVAPGPDALREGRACEGAARHLAGVLAARGVRCTPVVVYQGTEVYALPQQTMRAAGWVRTAEVRRVLRDVEEDLSGPPSSVHPAFFVRRAAETHFRMPEDA